MNDNGSFVDLRLNQQANAGNESFWPSFTDIMTVIMMIFLIAMVVVLLRNFELVKEVRSTMEAERQAMELARATGEEKATLAAQLDAALEQLHRSEEQRHELQLQVLRLQEQNQVRAAALDDRNRQISQLTEQRNDLTRQLERSQQAQIELQQQADLARQRQTTLEQRQAQDQQQIEALSQQLNELRDQLATQSELAENARQQQQAIEEKYLVLADEFDNLKVRYDKLVRPARSAKGRHLVEVRYFKRQGKYVIEWRDGGQGEFRTISRKALDERLQALQKQHANGLYIKVILPRNNGLSYSEAWKFTNHLHKSYDYYFQQTPPAAESQP